MQIQTLFHKLLEDLFLKSLTYNGIVLFFHKFMEEFFKLRQVPVYVRLKERTQNRICHCFFSERSLARVEAAFCLLSAWSFMGVSASKTTSKFYNSFSIKKCIM
jgi:hypothetical protein